ncbi:MAG: hypothetical protein H0S82_04380, partial [Anaerolineaceae bacterium]|nr:hypothetical protein [Anaerolineaceae bacterium]
FENLYDDTGDPIEFTQYDEDLALEVVERILIKDTDAAFAYAQKLDPSLTLDEFERDSQISRYQAKWYLRYRHASPEIAQKIVNYWANLGFEDLRTAQAEGEAETFVIVDLTQEASLPAKPIYQMRGTLVLAGALAGIVIGVLAVDGKLRFGSNGNQED